MTEKQLEAKLRNEVKKRGGLAFKFVSPGYDGVPDRLVMTFGQIRFVELKSPGKKPTLRQNVVHRLFLSFGFKVTIIDSPETLTAFLSEL